jgi:hypothetical protein
LDQERDEEIDGKRPELCHYMWYLHAIHLAVLIAVGLPAAEAKDSDARYP